ncbi:Lysophospholipase [Neolecta irregularis DAH-3]|uniref:Lysophospholipase n=1 Tax=Neolecta irregularis (strain DAH-3) TaxID=1198029 RepID=A0A1U7LUM8_NEOID|nr:Lysophospholipase [Neolecta irregularis DAH-3]|eukprot:OLL26318.1 Lysophospholipase [Neolecta irregularis DAH-3]
MRFLSRVIIFCSITQISVNSFCWPKQLLKRASPNLSYTPGYVECPEENYQFIRNADNINESERAYIRGRQKANEASYKNYFDRLQLSNFDSDEFLRKHMPRIGLALSGGGLRSVYTSAGVIEALDEGETKSVNHKTGGILQMSSYISGNSGSAWFVTAAICAGMPKISDLLQRTLNFETSLYTPKEGWLGNFRYWMEIFSEVTGKRYAGFGMTATDVWARMLSRRLYWKRGKVDLSFSGVSESDAFKNYALPFPTITAVGRETANQVIPENATVYEFNPYEMGSWDPPLNHFVKMEYLGTTLKDGKPVDGKCVQGFDDMSFATATSSSMFYIFLIDAMKQAGAWNWVKKQLLNFGSWSERDISYYPNPFQNSNQNTYVSSNPYLTLVDGGSANENIPFNPLIQPARALDVIITIDTSFDTAEIWPNGSSLVATYRRTYGSSIANGTPFPHIPGQDTFVNLGLSQRPTFFGCDSSNFTVSGGKPTRPPPIIVYIPNAPMSAISNITTLQFIYNTEQRDNVVQNGYNIMTRGGGELDDQWPICLGCAIIDRGRETLSYSRTDECVKCFNQYCWNGETDNTDRGVSAAGLLMGKSRTGRFKAPTSLHALKKPKEARR